MYVYNPILILFRLLPPIDTHQHSLQALKKTFFSQFLEEIMN